MITIRTKWTWEKADWLSNEIGAGNYDWSAIQSLNDYRLLAFCFAEDAIAFRLRFGL